MWFNRLRKGIMSERELHEPYVDEWTDPEIFERFKKGRILFHDATKEVVQGVFHEFVPEEGTILEIGSGVGELASMMPEENRVHLIALDQNPEFVKIQKRQSPELPGVAGDAQALPILESSVDCVTSYSAFDTLPDLQKAVNETQRVLKDGGTFVHLLDLQPNFPLLLKDLPSNVIPFPNIVDGVANGFQLVKKEDYPRIRERLDPLKIPMFDLLAEDPITTLAYLEQNNSHQITKSIAETIASMPDIDIEVTPTLKESFEQKMLETLAEAGFEIVFVGDRSTQTITPQNEGHLQYPDKNFFENNVGALYMQNRPELRRSLKPGEVLQKATLHAVIARKK